MPSITFEHIGIAVVVIVVLVGFIKIFSDSIDKRNQKDNELLNKFFEMNDRFNNSLAEIKKCLTENTLATRSTREYLERVENQTNQKLDKHDKRLDDLDNRVDTHSKEIGILNERIGRKEEQHD